MKGDFQRKLDAARERLPLARLMEQRGKPAGKRCPFCGKDGAGLFEHKGLAFFKCFHTSCPSGTHEKAFDAVGFLAFELGLTRREAAITYLKEAGVWTEERLAPSVIAPQKRRTPLPEATEPDQPPEEAPSADASADACNPRSDTPRVPLPAAAGSAPPEEMAAAATAAPLPPAAAVSDESDRSDGSDGSADAQPPDAPPDPGRPSGEQNLNAPPFLALRAFYERTALSDAEQTALWLKRGLTPETCARLGYRSNPRTNRAALLELAQEFPPAVLIESGLWLRASKPAEPPKPNAQYHGWGLAGKIPKAEREPDGPEWRWDWTEPVLIPYFQAGALVHLRPHKGMMREKPVRFYTVPLPADAHPTCAIITEGEFKAAALAQALGGDAAVGSLPGISMSKQLLPDIEDWLSALGVRQVIVAFDNEEKGDPNLPGYKPEKWKRYDTEVWARYLAKRLTEAGYEAGLARLPNAWRDPATGKADWDGALRRLLPEGAPSAVWPAHAARVRAEFLQVLKPVKLSELWRANWFEEDEERIIQRALENLGYQPQLPVGGDEEGILARRLQRLAAKLQGDSERMPVKVRGHLLMLAGQYLATRGRYYILKLLTEKTEERWLGYLKAATERSDIEARRVCEIVLKGRPTWVSDFYVQAHYCLTRTTGKRDRVVTLHNVHGGVSSQLQLPSEQFAQPSKFREWLLNNSAAATWRAGERELNDLQADLGRDLAHREVQEVALCGYHAASGLWFFEDVVIGPDGKHLKADRHGITWFAGKGYKLGDVDQEGQEFCQGRPRLAAAVPVTAEQARGLFVELAQKLNETLGGYEGYLALGCMLAYAAAPELYQDQTAFPGLWLHGETNQGKSSVARWLLRTWGFRTSVGMPLPDSTKVGISIALQQYGNLPVWLEEFQTDCPKWILEKIKGTYNRESGIKKTFDEQQRHILTNVIVTGVATSLDAQVRSRFVHVQVSESKRLANHYRWFEDTSPRFYQLGRFCLENRAPFVEGTLRAMRSWMGSESTAALDARSRIVHGAAHAAFVGMVGLLESHAAADVQGFREFLIRHCCEAGREFRGQVNVNQFWTDLMSALKGDTFGTSPAELRQLFKVVERPSPEGFPSPAQILAGGRWPQLAWKSYTLYFLPGPVLDRLRHYKRLQGQNVALDINDLRSQMKTREYWLPPADGYSHVMRFVGRVQERCWAIDVDRHEMGHQPKTDAEFDASLHAGGGDEFAASSNWVDPRRGDLFVLVDRLLKKEEAA